MAMAVNSRLSLMSTRASRTAACCSGASACGGRTRRFVASSTTPKSGTTPAPRVTVKSFCTVTSGMTPGSPGRGRPRWGAPRFGMALAATAFAASSRSRLRNARRMRRSNAPSDRSRSRWSTRGMARSNSPTISRPVTEMLSPTDAEMIIPMCLMSRAIVCRSRWAV